MSIQPINPDLASELIVYLQKEQELGKIYVVYSIDRPFTGTWDLECFTSCGHAWDFENENSELFDILNTTPIPAMLYMLREASGIRIDWVNGEFVWQEIKEEDLKTGRKR